MWVKVAIAAAVLLRLGPIYIDAQEYAGAKTCGACHPSQLARQSKTGHAHALHPAREHPLTKQFAAALLRTLGLWAFGAGEQAVTFVSQLNEDAYVEHHLTYYASTDSLLPTPGHIGSHSADEPGVLYPTFDPESRIMRCFGCHSTGPLALGEKFELVPAELGVRCEACHGPGRSHIEAARRGERSAGNLIRNPRRLSPVELNSVCGRCHRQPAPVGAATNWGDPWNVRHQPLYLDQSRCFRKSGRLSCLTCHDPHGPLEKNPVHYNSRCMGCHASKLHSRIAQPVGADCTGCHMPRVAPQRNLAFTNHWIGIYKIGSPLRPSE